MKTQALKNIDMSELARGFRLRSSSLILSQHGWFQDFCFQGTVLTGLLHCGPGCGASHRRVTFCIAIHCIWQILLKSLTQPSKINCLAAGGSSSSSSSQGGSGVTGVEVRSRPVHLAVASVWPNTISSCLSCSR